MADHRTVGVHVSSLKRSSVVVLQYHIYAWHGRYRILGVSRVVHIYKYILEMTNEIILGKLYLLDFQRFTMK